MGEARKRSDIESRLLLISFRKELKPHQKMHQSGIPFNSCALKSYMMCYVLDCSHVVTTFRQDKNYAFFHEVWNFSWIKLALLRNFTTILICEDVQYMLSQILHFEFVQEKFRISLYYIIYYLLLWWNWLIIKEINKGIKNIISLWNSKKPLPSTFFNQNE